MNSVDVDDCNPPNEMALRIQVSSRADVDFGPKIERPQGRFQVTRSVCRAVRFWAEASVVTVQSVGHENAVDIRVQRIARGTEDDVHPDVCDCVEIASVVHAKVKRRLVRRFVPQVVAHDAPA